MTMNRSWILETQNSCYAFVLNSQNFLVNTYWGKKLSAIKDYQTLTDYSEINSFDGPQQILNEEYPVHGGMSYDEVCLKLTFADGVRDTVLKFESTLQTDDETVLILRDSYYPLRVEIHYRIHSSFDIIERWVVIVNEDIKPILIEKAFSAQWNLPGGGKYYLSHLIGKWKSEFQLIREPLSSGTKILESRRITTSHQHNPWFNIDDGYATENSGNVWFGTLAWSGNWKFAADVTNYASTRIGIGINDWDFCLQLNKGEKFQTPSSFAGFTENGFGDASRKFHDFIRENIVPHKNSIHKVIYNSWEVTEFDVNVTNQMELADIAASIGIELFVIDDGWFHKRNNDKAGLGDWWADEKKFPLGLHSLIDHVNELGMDFGIWIEPEMVNYDSDLFARHPDWILHYPTRTPTLARNQLMLNLAIPAVQEYIINKIDTLLSTNKISFIKWDMNRNVSEPGWEQNHHSKEIWLRYVEGLYSVWGELKRRHPEVIWQSCSGGGGRVDPGILHFADQVWVSDNTNAMDRLKIQYGFSHAYPASVMESWVTDENKKEIPLSFRFHVSMCGILGIGADITKWSDQEIEEAAYWVGRYKKVRKIITDGDQYRSNENALIYLDKEKEHGVMFVFNTSSSTSQIHVKLDGMNSDNKYRIEGISSVRSGHEWMKTGFPMELEGKSSVLKEIHIEP